jgi:hypothetical protein
MTEWVTDNSPVSNRFTLWGENYQQPSKDCQYNGHEASVLALTRIPGFVSQKTYFAFCWHFETRNSPK